jgi:thioredoxin reductase (NADPH)
MEHVVILGTGIGGLTAAIYAARANLKPLIISGPEDGGQLTLTTEVENFPGFPDGILGPELITQSKKQAEKFGARFIVDIVNKFESKKSYFLLYLDGGDVIETKTLIISTGASARWLGLESEMKYRGRGVSSCATCDGAFFKEKEVVVIGGGDSAMEESLFLTKFAKKVTVIHRSDTLRASKIMQDKAVKNPKIAFLWNKEIIEVLGDAKKVTGVRLKDNVNGATTEFSCDGMFLAIGHVPNTGIFKGILDMDELGYLKTDRQMRTNLPGVFAAGDVQDRRYRQAITAAGSGCQAAIEVEKYLEEMNHH